MDGDNDPAPENANPSASETQTIFPRRADVKCHNTKGIWRQHSWPKISEMTEPSLFRMAFHEKRVRGVLIPETNGENFRGRHYPEVFLCVFGMPLLHGMLWGNLWPKIVVVPKTGIIFFPWKDPPSGCRNTWPSNGSYQLILPWGFKTSLILHFWIGFMMWGRW